MVRAVVLAALVLVASAFQAVAAEKVYVGLTSVQPPFVIDTKIRKGLAFDIIDALNALQHKYSFDASLFPVKRLLSDPHLMGQSVVAFNDENWGWKQRGGVGSVTLTNGKDVFFRLKGERTYDDLAAVRGFHYAFAGFDPDRLARLANVTLVKDEPTALLLLLKHRVGRAIASQAYLNWVSVSRPAVFQRLVVDAKPDQTYHRQFVVLPGCPVSVKELNALFVALERTRTLSVLFARYGLPPPPLARHRH